jgi:hypothetical protein
MIFTSGITAKSGMGWRFGAVRLTESLGVDPETKFDLTGPLLAKYPRDAEFLVNATGSSLMNVLVRVVTEGPGQDGFQSDNVQLTYTCSNEPKTKTLVLVLDEKDIGITRCPILAARQAPALAIRLRDEHDAFCQRRHAWVQAQRAAGLHVNNADYPAELSEDGVPIARPDKPAFHGAVGEIQEAQGCWTHDRLLDGKLFLPAGLNGRIVDVAYVIANMAKDRRERVVAGPADSGEDRVVKSFPERVRINGVEFTAHELSEDFVGHVPRSEGRYVSLK